MKKVLFLLLTFLVYSSINAQIMFKTEYFGTSGYRMTEGDTDQKVGDSKGSGSRLSRWHQHPLVYEIG